MNPETLYPRTIFAYGEGGAIYTADKDGRFYAIIDEEGMAGFLTEDDMEGLTLTKVFDFATAEERTAFLAQRYGRRTMRP